MKKLRAFFPYFGGKHRLAPLYPKPWHPTIVEPFAGSAGYSTFYWGNDVILLDAYPVIREVWKYLISVSEREIRSLPILREGQNIDELEGVPQEARWLIGFWLARGMSSPRKKLSGWGTERGKPNGQFWDIWTRDRIASQLDCIRHWKVLDGGYENAPNIEATWFVDPPYHKAGSTYKVSDVDYEALAGWCLGRVGDVIVCEQEGAEWLPFKHFSALRGIGGAVKSRHPDEVVWIR